MKPLLRRRASLPLFTLIALAVYNIILGFQILRDHEAIVEAARLRAENIAHVMAREIANYLTFVDATLESMDFLAAILPPISIRPVNLSIENYVLVVNASFIALLVSVVVLRSYSLILCVFVIMIYVRLLI